jgi:ribosome biogenesis GTPase
LHDIISISNRTGEGLDLIRQNIEPYNTYCILGSSGVGKSTLINKLLGRDQIKTIEISDSTGKGKHTTTHREIFILSNKGLLLDTPGMREVGMADTREGISSTFTVIEQLAEKCRFIDCSHQNEPDCAVQKAIQNKELDPDILENYNKLKRETARFTTSESEKRKKDKQFGKMQKEAVKIRKNKKY